MGADKVGLFVQLGVIGGPVATTGGGGDGSRPVTDGRGAATADYLEDHPEADATGTELMINVLYTAELLGRRVDRFLRPYGLARGSHNVLQVLGGATEPLTPALIEREKAWAAAALPRQRERLISLLGAFQGPCARSAPVDPRMQTGTRTRKRPARCG